MKTDLTPTFCPSSQKDWREWLRKNHKSRQSVWLVLYKKKTGIPSVNWSDAVDQALCFGWIDGKRLPLSEEKFMQSFSKRKPKGTWSNINKEKVERLIQKRLMTKAGREAIEVSRQNGSWDLLNSAEALEIPNDLEAAFKLEPGLKRSFSALPRSKQKFLLMKLTLSKRPETRKTRVAEIVASCRQVVENG